MKAIIVFSPLNDITFLSNDAHFEKFINDKARKDGLIDEDAEPDPSHLDTDVVTQIFSPLLNSFRFMVGHVGNPYHTIECEDKLTYVFQLFSDFTYIAVSQGGQESEQFVNRKLSVLHRILTFLYGPVIEEVHAVKLSERRRRWLLVDSLLTTWCRLYNTEQSFLVEAVERLYVNQQLSIECVNHLEEVLKGFQQAGEKTAMHALVLVNSKLLTLFSSKKAQELSSADILLLTVLVNTIFVRGQLPPIPVSPPPQHSISMLRSVSIGARSLKIDNCPVRKVGDDSSLVFHDNSSQSGIEYTSHSDSDISQHASSSSDDKLTGLTARSPYPRFFPEAETSCAPPNNPQTLGATAASSEATSASFIDKRQQSFSPDWVHISAHDCSSRSPEPTPQTGEVNEELMKALSANTSYDNVQSLVSHHRKVTVMLNNSLSRYAPHVAHCIQIHPGTVLIVLSEIPKAFHAALLSSLIAQLKRIGNYSNKQPPEVSVVLDDLAQLDATLKKLTDIGKHYKGMKPIEKVIHDILARWDTFKQDDVFTELKAKKGPLGSMPPRLESTAGNMAEKVKHLFRVLFLTWRKMPQDIQCAVDSAMVKAQDELAKFLADYNDYLMIKSQRNITINTYLEDFPGLVHFIYVDRTSDHMVAPCINIADDMDCEKNDIPNRMKLQLKRTVWKSVQWIQDKLSDGFMGITARDGDYLISYFIWFEDPMGNRLALKEPLKTKEGMMPGILTSNFYKRLIQECFPVSTANVQPVRCYELMCTHIGLLPSHYVFGHCRKLAAMLWETSGCPKSPLPFI